MKLKLPIIVLLCILMMITNTGCIRLEHQNEDQPPVNHENTDISESTPQETSKETQKNETSDSKETIITTGKKPKPLETKEQGIDEILANSESNYFIYIELGGGTITVYDKNAGSSYDEIVLSSPVSVGLDSSTPTGIFTVTDRKAWLEIEGEGFVQYATLTDIGLSISSSLYEANDRNTLIRKSYNKIGQPATYGNLYTLADTAYFIMQNCLEGTVVQIVEGSPKNISCDPVPELNPDYYFTDPTDPSHMTLEELEKRGEIPYSIYVEKGSFTMTVYRKDEKGEYTVPVRAFNVAVGRTAGRTPVGDFEVYKKERWHMFPGNGGYAQYATSYYGNLFIHSPLYGLEEIDTMLAEFYNEIGTNATAGCLRTTSYASYWVYSYCPMGTPVTIVNGSPIGTVSEKPPKIPDVYMTTDPTDPFNPDSVY